MFLPRAPRRAWKKRSSHGFPGCLRPTVCSLRSAPWLSTCQPSASSQPTVYFWLLFPGLVAMHAACGRSSGECRPHFDCSASWKMMIIIFDRREGGGRRSPGFQICSVISRILQGPSDGFSRPKGNGVCIARGVTGKIPLFTRTNRRFFHQAFHLVRRSCHSA